MSGVAAGPRPAARRRRPSRPTSRRSARSTRSQAPGLLARGEYRAFYIALTAVAKRYLERRLGGARCSR